MSSELYDRLMQIIITLFTVILVAVCLLMILAVLMQRPRQEGLGAAFGGAMADKVWGAQTTNVLQRATVWLAVMFFVLSLLISILMAKQQGATKPLDDALAAGPEEEKVEETPPAANPIFPGTATAPITIPATNPVTPATTTTPGSESATPSTTPPAEPTPDAGDENTETPPAEPGETPADPEGGGTDPDAPAPADPSAGASSPSGDGDSPKPKEDLADPEGTPTDSSGQ